MKIQNIAMCLAAFMESNRVIAMPFTTIIYQENEINKKDENIEAKKQNKSPDQSQDPQKNDAKTDDKSSDSAKDDKSSDSAKNAEKSPLRNDPKKPPKPNTKKLLNGWYYAGGLGYDISRSTVTAESQNFSTTLEDEWVYYNGRSIDDFVQSFKNNIGSNAWLSYYSTTPGSVTPGSVDINLSSCKKVKIANVRHTLPMLSLVVGYGEFCSDKLLRNLYWSGEFAIDFGKTNRKNRCFNGWEHDYVRSDSSHPELYNQFGLYDTIEKNGLSFVLAARGGYYWKSIDSLLYLKVGLAYVNVALYTRTSNMEGTRFRDEKIKISKIAPEIMVGIEKIVRKSIALRVEIGYRLAISGHGNISSEHWVDDDESQDTYRYDCKTRMNLESSGYVVRILAVKHLL
ncbi:MAG: hypothetical protein LBB12_02000 [Holosporaceae bacterium]|jgi:opacity protein-like surface antigen|nr:hypothetical protein [Holosporaceae bacterium]